ncbi:hypothetical protein [Amycolatopsis sp. NBC_00438]|uniref:hypothetical protein n=1 Tax=Amycolatopsis sp. NBC_00438 TaxID=2903558 RepID=UPI002E1FACB2
MAIVVPLTRRHTLSPFEWALGVCGVAFVWVPVAVRLRARRGAEYVVTDRRIVLADRFSGRTRASVYLGTLPPPVARIRQDGSGTIDFGRFVRAPVMPFSSLGSLMLTGLVAVPEAGRVRDLIARAQAGQG